MQYEPNLRIHLLGICTYANTPILAPWTKFWPHGPNFDQISQIRSVISYLGQKNCISRSKVVQFGNFKFSTLQDPQNPKLAPPLAIRFSFLPLCQVVFETRKSMLGQQFTHVARSKRPLDFQTARLLFRLTLY